MINNELLLELSKNLVSCPNNYMNSLRSNLLMYIEQKDISLHNIAEDAGISFETLKSLVYGTSKDCKLSTIVSLAKALNVSVDELVGCGTLDDEVRTSIQISRSLPHNYLRFVRWAIRYHGRMLHEKRYSSKAINVMLSELTNEGNVLLSNNFELVDINNISELIMPKVFMGIKMPCDNYMPIYGEGDILLIANDRPPMPNETAVILFGGFMWLSKRRIDVDSEGNKLANYYSIRDGKFRVTESDIEELIGYVAGVHR